MYFLVKVKYTKQLENGAFKRVIENYLVEAMESFTDAEARIYEELSPQIRGEFIVMKIDKFELHTVFSFDDSETWNLVKISFTDLDDNREIKQRILVAADTVAEANIRINESISDLVRFQVISVQKSNIVEVFPIFKADVI